MKRLLQVRVALHKRLAHLVTLVRMLRLIFYGTGTSQMLVIGLCKLHTSHCVGATGMAACSMSVEAEGRPIGTITRITTDALRVGRPLFLRGERTPSIRIAER